MSDDMQTIAEQAAKDARDVFESYGGKAREAIDYMEQLIYAALRETERALPAAEPAEDVRAGALREALRAIDALPEYQSPDVNIGVGNAYSAIVALIPEAKT